MVECKSKTRVQQKGFQLLLLFLKSLWVPYQREQCFPSWHCCSRGQSKPWQPGLSNSWLRSFDTFQKLLPIPDSKSSQKLWSSDLTDHKIVTFKKGFAPSLSLLNRPAHHASCLRSSLHWQHLALRNFSNHFPLNPLRAPPWSRRIHD